MDPLEEIHMLLSQLTEEPVDPGELEGLCQLASLLVELQNQVHCHIAAANPELFDITGRQIRRSTTAARAGKQQQQQQQQWP